MSASSQNGRFPVMFSHEVEAALDLLLKAAERDALARGIGVIVTTALAKFAERLAPRWTKLRSVATHALPS